MGSAIRARLAELQIDELPLGVSLEDAGPKGSRGSGAQARERYVMRGEIARGGMGAVLHVWDTDLRRNIAMKIVLEQGIGRGEGRGSEPQALARFLEEAQVTGQLDHPGVVPVHELGIEDDGRMYFTMRLVRGQDFDTIIELAREQKDGWNLTRALGTLMRVCETMAFAHSKGVVHRDLKPANVMVGPFGETYVMDWGLAKVVGRRDTRAETIRDHVKTLGMSSVLTERSEKARAGTPSPLDTQQGSVIGTPYYMPPEQAAGRIDEIGPASDVYSAGCMLYQLLTGLRPYEKPGNNLSLHTLLAMVLHSPPTPVANLNPTVPGELVAICERAMAHNRADRYPSMLEMRDDLRAFLEGRVVRAYEGGPVAEIKKWVRRHSGLASALAALVVLCLASVGGILWMQNQRVAEITAERNQTAIAKKEAEDNARRAEANAGEAVRHLYATNIIAAEVSLRAGEIRDAKRHLAESPPELVGWEWRHLSRRADASLLRLEAHEDVVTCLAVDPGGRRLLSGSDDGTARLWDVETGELLFTLEAHEEPVLALAFAADGAQAITVSGAEAEMKVWDLATKQSHSAKKFGDHASRAVVLDVAGERLACGTSEGTIKIQSARTTQVLASLPGHERGVIALAFSPDGKRMLSGSVDNTVKMWDLETLAELWSFDGSEPIEAVAFRGDGQEVASGAGDGALRRHDAATGAVVWEREQAHASEVDAVAYSPDGEHLASGSFDKLIRVWDRESSDPIATLRGHDQAIRTLAFSSDGKRVYSASEDLSVRVWALASSVAVSTWTGPDDYVSSVAVSPDGEQVLAGTAFAGTRALLDLPTGDLRAQLAGADDPVNAVVFSPTGRFYAWGGEEPDVHLWDLDSNAKHLDLVGHSSSVTSLAFSPDGARIVSGSKDRKVRVWEVASGHDLALLDSHPATVHAVGFSNDGRYIVSADSEGGVFVSLAENGEVVRALARHPAAVLTVRYSPDGKYIATGCADHQLRLWNAASGELEQTLPGHDSNVTALDFSPDGTRIVSASNDKTLRIWNAHTGQFLVALRGHEEAVTDVAFAPDGDRVVSASFDNTVRIWHAAQ